MVGIVICQIDRFCLMIVMMRRLRLILLVVLRILLGLKLLIAVLVVISANLVGKIECHGITVVAYPFLIFMTVRPVGGLEGELVTSMARG